MLYAPTNPEDVEDPELREELEDFDIFYFDHIQSNGNKQDSLCVFSILEAFFIRVKKELPHIESLSLQSDNAKCYQACELVLYVYLLSKHYGLKVTRLIHTETQDGKSVIDGHFAIAMMHVMRLVSSGHNAVTPAQLVSLLRSNGGLVNCYPELFRMSRDTLAQLSERYAKSLKRLEGLGRWNEITFLFNNDGDDMMEIFEYSGLDSVSLNLSELIATDDSDGDQDEPERVHGGDDSEADEGGDRDEDDDEDEDHTEDEDQSEEELLDAGLDDAEMDDDVEDAAGPITGVVIESDAHIARLQKRWKKSARKERLDDLAVIDDVTSTMCSRCNKFFSSEAFLKRHICQGEPEKRDVISFCCKRALELYQSGALDVVVATRRDSYDASILERIEIVEDFASGWARRPAHGAFYGAKYLPEFKDDIMEMYNAGVKDSSSKMCMFHLC